MRKKQVEASVAILGCIRLNFYKPSYSQYKNELIASCERTTYFKGGFPNTLVTNNLKSAVKKFSKFEPIIKKDCAEQNRKINLRTKTYKPINKQLCTFHN